MKKLKLFLTLILSISILTTSSVFSENYDCSKGKHKYKVTITKPVTEKENGTRLYKCTLCGYSYKETIPKTGHEWSSWKPSTSATCSKEGREYQICTKHKGSPHYNYRKTALNPNKHNFIKTKTKAATCEEDGYILYTCSECGKTKTKNLSALGHKYSKWTIEKDASENESGLKYKACANDSSHKIEEVIPKLAVNNTSTPENQTFFNRLDYILLIINVLIISSFSFLIYYDYNVISWDKKKKKEFIKRQIQ